MKRRRSRACPGGGSTEERQHLYRRASRRLRDGSNKQNRSQGGGPWFPHASASRRWIALKRPPEPGLPRRRLDKGEATSAPAGEPPAPRRLEQAEPLAR